MKFARIVHAFSLIECILVLGIILMMVTVSLPRLSFFNRILVRSDLERIAMTCAYAQRCAMVNGVSQEMFFDITRSEFKIGERVDKLSRNVLFGSVPGAKGPPSAPEHLISSPITFKQCRMTFYPDGKMQPGAVYLTDHDHTCLYALTVAVSHISSIREYRYGTERWERIA